MLVGVCVCLCIMLLIPKGRTTQVSRSGGVSKRSATKHKKVASRKSTSMSASSSSSSLSSLSSGASSASRTPARAPQATTTLSGGGKYHHAP